ncbi:MAG TPA: 50S ribosomal protein L23, partial [Isosphaeraceae bacterium]
MVTLRHAPQCYHRSGPELEPYQVILRPLITERATYLSERQNAYTFEVNARATKTEIKHAVETLFGVKVVDVRTQNCHGKLRRHRLKVGRTRNWKKAIVAVHHDHRIDFGPHQDYGIDVGRGRSEREAERARPAV